MNSLRLFLGGMAALLFVGLLAVSPQGLPDIRVFGYSPPEIDAWAQDGQAVELASGPVFALDMLFPAVLAAFLITLVPRWATLLPIVYAALDYCENFVLQGYYVGLDAGLPLSPWASALTQAKWLAVALAVGAMLWRIARAKGPR